MAAWLTVKILLLVVYVVLGSYAIKRGVTRRIRLVCWVAALVVYLTIVSIARTRDPWGWLGQIG